MRLSMISTAKGIRAPRSRLAANPRQRIPYVREIRLGLYGTRNSLTSLFAIMVSRSVH